MKAIGIIPARMASSRFPGKPMADILDIPMVGHCYYRARMCDVLHDVYVATCDREIHDYIEGIGGKAVMTADTHERASDRCAEAMDKIEVVTGERVDIVVMIQGDEPMIRPQDIEAAVRPMLEDDSVLVVNLMAPIETRAEHDDPNEVKVVVDREDNALYFSREPIPSWKKGAKNVEMLKQVCVIPFRRDFLLTFNELEPTPLEVVESVDMLRVLEHGYDVKMVRFEGETYSVDTTADLERVAAAMEGDPLVKQYKTGRAADAE